MSYSMPVHPRLISIHQQVVQHPVLKVYIALGELFPLTEQELRAQWNELVLKTPLEQTKLIVRIINAEQQCMICFEKYHPRNKETACPNCGSVGAKILAGEEFYLESINE